MLHVETTVNSPCYAEPLSHPSHCDSYMSEHRFRRFRFPAVEGPFAIQVFPDKAPDIWEQKQVSAVPCLNF